MKLGEYKELVIRRVPVSEYFRRIFPAWVPGSNVVCPFHDDKVASMSIHEETGATYCHACEHKSSSFVGFHEQFHKVSFEESLRAICNDWIEPLVPEVEIKRAQELLFGDQEVMAHIETVMGLTRETITKLGFGLSPDRERIWIPIQNEVGWVVDVRKYYWRRPKPEGTPKTISYRTGYGGARFWPYSALTFNTIYFFEGERDTALAIQDGLNAVTLTTGGKTALHEKREFFRDKHVIFIPDLNDKERTGEDGVSAKVAELKGIAASIKVVTLDLPASQKGGDYSDYRLGCPGGRPHTIAEFLQLVEDSATLFRQMRAERVTRGEFREVSLRDIQKPENFDKNVSVRAHVIGKTQTPWLLPQRFKVACDAAKFDKCDDCPLKADGGARVDVLQESDRILVGMAGVSDAGLSVMLRRHIGIKQQCQFDYSVESTHHVTHLTLVPELDVAADNGTYLTQVAYAVNCQVEANRGYDFRGYVTSDPRSQAAVFVITAAEPIQDSIDRFALDPEDISRLRLFQTERLGKSFSAQAKVMSTNVTKIRGRDDLWLLCDLTFHSVQGFMFGEELVPKGWLDILVIGDTRCGKGYTAERLVHYYGLGEVVSAENCTYAGLVGGMLQSGDKWQIIWGKIPLGDRRLVILDEAKSLSTEDIGRMSRLRSEGIAEVAKIQTERTLARTRLIWLTNTREGRLMRTYDYGVNAVPEFVGHAEDIARFDLALSVMQGEVAVDLINQPTPSEIENPWPQDAARKLILWAWSRRPDQVRFTPAAVRATLDAAKRLGAKYSPAIPLIQVENVRYKIARLAAAVAAKAFRTRDGEILEVDEDCVIFAITFMENCYDKPSMSYNWFSDSSSSEDDVDPTVVTKIVERIEDKNAFIRGMLGTQAFSAPDMADFTGIDLYETKIIIGVLVRHGCIYKTGPVYRKKPGFIKVLRSIQAELSIAPGFTSSAT